MTRKITVNHKEFAMPKMDVDTYMDYLDLSQAIEAKDRFSREDFEAMTLFIVKAYGNQFTVEELKDIETGLSAAEVVIEFNFIESNVANEVDTKVEKIKKNMSGGK